MAVDVENFIGELDAGVFQEKLSRVLSDVAANIMDHERKGNANVKFEMTKTGSCQVKVAAKISFEHPTLRGKKTETDSTETVMYISKTPGESGVNLTLFPPNQTQMFDKKGRPNPLVEPSENSN